MNKKFIPILLLVCCLGLFITYIANHKSMTTTSNDTNSISSKTSNNYNSNDLSQVKDNNSLKTNDNNSSKSDYNILSKPTNDNFIKINDDNSSRSNDTTSLKTNVNNSSKINDDVKDNVPNENSTPKKSISISKYIKNLDCIKYKVKKGDTLTNISRAYESTCNLNTSVQILKLVNNLSDTDNLEIGDIIYIPKKALTTGKLFYINSGETWYNIISNNYPGYTVESVLDFLIKINVLPNSDCPLGEKVYLPKLS